MPLSQRALSTDQPKLDAVAGGHVGRGRLSIIMRRAISCHQGVSASITSLEKTRSPAGVPILRQCSAGVTALSAAHPSGRS